MYILLLGQVLHTTSNLGTHHHQTLANIHHLQLQIQTNMIFLNILLSHIIIISSLHKDKILSFSLEVLQQTPIGHIWHHNIRGRACIKAHSNEAHHMSMFEPTHLQTLFNKLIHFCLIKITCKEKYDNGYIYTIYSYI